MLALTDSQLALLAIRATAIAPHRRSAWLRGIANQIEGSRQAQSMEHRRRRAGRWCARRRGSVALYKMVTGFEPAEIDADGLERRSPGPQPERPCGVPVRASRARHRPVSASAGSRYDHAGRQGHVSDAGRLCRVRTLDYPRARSRWLTAGQA